MSGLNLLNWSKENAIFPAEKLSDEANSIIYHLIKEPKEAKYEPFELSKKELKQLRKNASRAKAYSIATNGKHIYLKVTIK
jgi:hypothetical protein